MSKDFFLLRPKRSGSALTCRVVLLPAGRKVFLRFNIRPAFEMQFNHFDPLKAPAHQPAR